jgi:ferredoxin-type protein NapG
MNRREFLKKGTALLVVGGTGGYALTLLIERGGGSQRYFRPPGAGDDESFLARCIRCARCVQACPYKSIKLGDISDGAGAGAPFLRFREVPCYMCEDLPCIKSCPTDALDPGLTDVNRMVLGTAVITDREACLSLNGVRCEICYRVCPLIDKAITVEKHQQKITRRHTVFEPVIHKNVCTGCGICENACPLDETAITVLSSQRGDKAGHYYYLGEQGGES